MGKTIFFFYSLCFLIAAAASKVVDNFDPRESLIKRE